MGVFALSVCEPEVFRGSDFGLKSHKAHSLRPDLRARVFPLAHRARPRVLKTRILEVVLFKGWKCLNSYNYVTMMRTGTWWFAPACSSHHSPARAPACVW